MKALWLTALLAAASSTLAGPPATGEDGTAAPPATGSTATEGPAPEATAAAQDAPEAEAATPTDAAASDTATPAEPDPVPPARYDLRSAHAPPGDPVAGKAKAEVCTTACHGTNGIGIAPVFPNMAGQKAAYMYWNLHAYKSGRMPPTAMAPLAASLEEQDIRDVAAYFASLPMPPPAADAPPVEIDAALASQGQSIYMNGDPSKGIPPCQGCHGSDARGNPQAGFVDRSGRTPYAAYPLLRGQKNDYLQTRLQEYHDDAIDASTNSRVMHGIGRQLDPDSIKAVSTWLSSLKE